MIPAFYNKAGDAYSVVNIAGAQRLQTSGAANSWGSYAFSFQLNDCANTSAFLNLYDQYRIDRVEVYIGATDSGLTGNASVATLVTAPSLWIQYALDFDDWNAPTSATYLDQYESSIVMRHDTTGRPYNPAEAMFSFVPHTAVATLGTGLVFTSYGNKGPSWIDSASAAVAHMGVKFLLPSPLSTSLGNPCYDVRFKYHLSFRGVR